MERRKVSLAIALTMALGTLVTWRGNAQAQCPDGTTGMYLQAMGANDLQASSFASTPWWSA